MRPKRATDRGPLRSVSLTVFSSGQSLVELRAGDSDTSAYAGAPMPEIGILP
ncbi:MAG: hypothetical protein V7646_661 [Pseudonocardia sp.]